MPFCSRERNSHGSHALNFRSADMEVTTASLEQHPLKLAAIAAAGPLVNAVIAVVCYCGYAVAYPDEDSLLSSGNANSTPGVVTLFVVCIYNS
jgi:hypothetical protein